MRYYYDMLVAINICFADIAVSFILYVALLFSWLLFSLLLSFIAVDAVRLFHCFHYHFFQQRCWLLSVPFRGVTLLLLLLFLSFHIIFLQLLCHYVFFFFFLPFIIWDIISLFFFFAFCRFVFHYITFMLFFAFSFMLAMPYTLLFLSSAATGSRLIRHAFAVAILFHASHIRIYAFSRCCFATCYARSTFIIIYYYVCCAYPCCVIISFSFTYFIIIIIIDIIYYFPVPCVWEREIFERRELSKEESEDSPPPPPPPPPPCFLRFHIIEWLMISFFSLRLLSSLYIAFQFMIISYHSMLMILIMLFCWYLLLTFIFSRALIFDLPLLLMSLFICVSLLYAGWFLLFFCERGVLSILHISIATYAVELHILHLFWCRYMAG